MYSFQSFKVWDLLKTLGPSEFGLISQALLAICFKSAGATIVSLKQTGHPDIEMEYEDKYWRLEVGLTFRPDKSYFEVKNEDLESTKPLTQLDIGYFGVLDCNYPVGWKLIDMSKLLVEGKGNYSMNKLSSICNSSLSTLCTGWTAKSLL